MADKIMCMACDTEEAYFTLVYKEYDGDPENYCPECMSNIVKEVPEDVEKITPLEAI